MAHLSELSSALQTALDRNVVFNWPYAEIMLDPDGDAIDLSDYLLDEPLVISKSKNINPDESFGKISISELTVRFINRDNYFSPYNIDGPFYHATSRLYADYSAGTTTIDVPKDFSVKVGLIITVSRGAHSDSAVIQSIDESDSYYNRLTLNSVLSASYSYPGGSLIETKYRVGQFMRIRTKFNGLSDTINQYQGIIASLPKIKGAIAEITLQDSLKGLLNNQLKANTTKRMITTVSTVLQGSMQIERADSTSPSTGNIPEDSIQVNSAYCTIGSWEIEFTSATEFTVTDPNNVQYSGQTTANFYAGDSSIYQIKILSSAWSGTWDDGDRITFNTYCTICKANFGENGDKIPHIIEQIITQDFGGALTSSDYDTAAIAQLKSDYYEYRGGISFDRSLSVLKAIEILLRHLPNTSVYFLNDGMISFKSHKPTPSPSTPNTLSPDADIIEVELSERQKYQRIVGYWDWDYQNNQFNKKYSYPAEEGEPHIEVKLPAFTANESIYAQSIIRKIFDMWERGVRVYAIREKWNYGVGWELSDIIQISSDFPELSDTIVEIFELKKSANKPQAIEALAFDVSFQFARYLFINEGRLNDGRVVW